MPFALLTIGTILVVVAFQDTYKQFGSQVVSDFSGQGNFFYWIISIGVLGSLGYIKEFRPVANTSLVLLLIVMVLKNKGGFFDQFNSAISSGTSTPVKEIGGALPADSSSSASSGGSGGGISIGDVASVAALFP